MILTAMQAMISRLSLSSCLGILAFSLSAAPALAHHRWGWDCERGVEITGTVSTGVSLAGPHATMKVLSDGKVWDITLAPPARTEHAGLKEGVIPVGATVTIHGHRNRDANRFEMKGERVTWKSRTFNVYPDRT